MALKHLIPDDPLGFIRRCVIQRKIYWTYHLNMRLKDRFILRRAIIDSHDNYEIIEQYPEDKYLPSYLVRSECKADTLHILFAVDVIADNIRIITAYRPTLDDWEDGFRMRRQSS